jgi:hypothetical protein
MSKSFSVSGTIRIDAIVGDTRPYIVIHQGIAPGQPPKYLVVGLDEVKKLTAQLVEAALYLGKEHENIQGQ